MRKRHQENIHLLFYLSTFQEKRGVFCASLLLEMNLGINFCWILGSLLTFFTHTGSYKSKKVSGRFPDGELGDLEGHAVMGNVTIPAVTPTFSSTSRPAASPEVPRDTSSSHVPLGSHVIHPCAPSRTIPRDPVSRPCWV